MLRLLNLPSALAQSTVYAKRRGFGTISRLVLAKSIILFFFYLVGVESWRKTLQLSKVLLLAQLNRVLAGLREKLGMKHIGVDAVGVALLTLKVLSHYFTEQIEVENLFKLSFEAFCFLLIVFIDIVD